MFVQKWPENQRGESGLSQKIVGIESNRIYSVWITHVTHRGEKSPGATLEILVGGNSNIFPFLPRKLGKMNPFWRAYFSKGLVQPPTRNWMARPSTCKPTMWNKALRALIVQMSVRETRLKPSRETTRNSGGRDDGEVAQRFKWWLGMGKSICESMCEGNSWVVSGRFEGGGCVFFCQPDNLGVNDSQFDFLVDTFPKCVFWRQGSLIQSEGAPISHGCDSGWFSNGYNLEIYQLPPQRWGAQFLVASEVSQKWSFLHLS